MEICPIDRLWIHTYLVEPYLKGCELMNQAWMGVDRSLIPNSLSLKERVICWLQGICLMLPFINTIIWLAWQAFGSPEKLDDPFCPEVDPPPSPRPVLIHEVQPPAEGEAPTEQFVYVERVGDSEYQTHCTVQQAADLNVVQQTSTLFSTTSLYRPDFSLKELHYQFGSKQIDLRQNGENRTEVYVQISENEPISVEQRLELEPIPWIQQRIGFKPFVMSHEQELDFNAVVPEYPPLIRILPLLARPPFVMKMVARKIGQEEVPGFGTLLKIEIASKWRWPYNAIKSELWFDPTTGALKKFVDSGTFISEKVGELVQSNRSPG